jgi:uncharacterized integral membrane protein
VSKKLVFALVLIGLTVIVLLLNRSELDLNLLVGKVKAAASFVYLGFVVIGVVIGMLLK